MTELIWGILNIVIFIYFIIICFKSTKVIREKLGILASIIFVFGLLSFIAKPNDESSEIKTFDIRQNIKQYKFEGNTYLSDVKLENDLATEIKLSVKFGENENGKKLISAQTTRSGFVSGMHWKTQNIILRNSKTEDQFVYNVSGILEWRILGLKVYSESKIFNGKIELTK